MKPYILKNHEMLKMSCNLVVITISILGITLEQKK